MKQLDKLTGILFMGISAFLFTRTSNLLKDSGKYVRAMLVVLFVLGAVLLIDSIRKEKHFKFEDIKKEFSDVNWGRTLFAILFTVIYIVSMPYVGFIVGSLVYMVVLMLVLGVRNVKILTILPVGLTVVLYIAFAKMLSIRLPDGILSGIL